MILILLKPINCIKEPNRRAEGGVLGELIEDESGGGGVGGEAAEGLIRPDAFLFLEVGEVLDAEVDGRAEPAIGEKSAETDGGSGGVAKATIGLLLGKKEAQDAGGQGGRGLAELFEADQGDSGSGGGELEGEPNAPLRANGHQLSKKSLILS